MKALSKNNLFHLRRTVARDLMLWLNLAVSLTLVVIGAAYYYFSTESLYNSLNKKALDTTEEIANVLKLPLFNVDDDAIRHTASVYMATGRLAGIRIESTVNGVIVDRLPVKDINLPRMEKSITRNGLTLGRVKLAFNDKEIRDMQRGAVWITVMTIIVVVLVNAFVIRRIMHFVLISPLARLTRRIEDIASGTYHGSMAHVPQDDLNKLIISANRMSEQIEIRTRQLTESEMRYREIYNATSEAILLLDAETGTILDVNQTMLDMYGYTGEEALKLTVSDLSLARPPYTQKEALQWIRRAVEQCPQFFEWRARRKNGELFWVEVSMSSSEIGGQRRVLAVVRDITERRKAEEALRASEQRYRSLVDNIDLGVTLINRDHEIVMTNKAQGRFFRKDPEEFTGRKCYREFEKRDHVCVHCPGLSAMETLHAAQVETSGRRDDGSTFAVHIHAFPVIGPSGKAEGFIEVIEDITERKRLEEELQRSHRLESIGILAGGIAHDFNNLLTAILNNVYLTKNYIDRESKGFKSLEAAEKAGLRAVELTRQLLTFSRGGEPVRQTTSIINVIKESAEFVLRGSNVKCEYDIADGLWPVDADQGQMSQVIHNLILNADQAMPEGGVIRISAKNTMPDEGDALPLKKGRYVKIVIRDEGIGIAKEHFQKIFDPYFSTKETGRGLGLAIIYSIIRQHDGYISVESEMSAGTTFTIYIPASRKQIGGEKTKDDAMLQGKGKILLMDDEEIIRASLGEMLNVMGYEVEFAENGADAVEIYMQALETSQPFDAVILDLTVPGGMGGKETIKKLIRIDPDVRAVVSSGYSNDPVMANFREYGFSALLAKPYDIGELSRVLNNVIDGG